MARKAGESAQRVSAAGMAGEGNGIPPSTIAAQIVNNHSRANETQEPQNNALFGHLLQDFLADPAAENPDAPLSLQLISVVVEAGFNALLRENPFGHDVLLSQAKDGISVIQIIVERSPDLLFRLDRDDVDSAIEPPLVAKLLPKLFSLLSRPSFESLHTDLRELLYSFIQALSTNRFTWYESTVLIETYQACISAIITSLESGGSVSFATSFSGSFAGPSLKLTLPPHNLILQMMLGGQQLVALPQSCQMEIDNPAQAVNLALGLLCPICRHLDSSSAMFIAGRVQVALPDWVADCLSRLWDCCDRLRLLNRFPTEQTDQLVLAFLSVFNRFAPQATGSRTEAALSAKVPTTFYEILADVTEQVCQHPPSSAVQAELSHVLLQTTWLNRPMDLDKLTNIGRVSLPSDLFAELLVPTLESISQDESLIAGIQDDLRNAIALSIVRQSPQEASFQQPQASFHPPWVQQVGSGSFENAQLVDRFSELLLETQQEEFPDNERPRKRQRLEPSIEKSRTDSYWDRLIAKFGLHFSGTDQSSLEDIQSTVEENFTALSGLDKCEALTTFMRLPCAAVGSLKGTLLSNGEIIDTSCVVCDGNGNEDMTAYSAWSTDEANQSWRAAVKILEKLISLPELSKLQAPRVLIATAIRNLLSHINDRDSLSLSKSILGKWCIKSLKSTLRELRIAAGFALPVFLRDTVPEDIRESNRMVALNSMMQIAERGHLVEQEALILAWGQVARSCGEDELEIALSQLVNYLGHTNPFIHGVAFNELAAIANALNCRPLELMRPFWKAIGFEVFKDLSVRPQKAQQLSDLVEMSVNQLLMHTQNAILPYLVLMKKKDVLKRLADARGTTVQDLCLQDHRNLASIMAMLLMHPADNIEISVISLLRESIPKAAEEGLGHLISLQPALIASEILKAAAVEEGERKKQIHRAFHTVASVSERHSSGRQSMKEDKILARFLETNILGMMTQFSGGIDSTKIPPQPLSERSRCLGAIDEIITLAGSYASLALPQIRACLQSALQDPQLCNKAFFIWCSLLDVVDNDDIEPLVDQTFSIVVRYWDSFVPSTQEKAFTVISELVQKHNILLQERICMLPSLKSIPIFTKIEAEINRLREKSSVNPYEAFTRRCQDENASVVIQALREMIPYLETHQELIHDTTNNQHPSHAIAELCRSILDASIKFTESHSEVAILSAQCLGLIGCLDPSRTETVRPRRETLVLSNFDRADEAIEFVAFMLETVLVKSFHSATNAISQAYIAYTMQELLKFCQFGDEATAHRPRSSQGSPTYQRWMQIPETVRSTLTPFLTSKYEIHSLTGGQKPPAKYPIFSAELGHTTWLRDFAFDLLRRPKGDNARMVFPVLARIIKGHDLAIATFLLPFAVVNVTLGGTEKDVEDISQELLLVLESELKGSGPEAENVRQCSENVFQVLDYMSKWLQEKRKQVNEARMLATRAGRELSELDEITVASQMSIIERVLHSIPAEVISRRAVECGSYARALFHWEQYVRQRKEQAELKKETLDQESLYQHLQHIYTQIDEPDSIEGISAHLQILDPAQQVLDHRKAGRWTAAQSWYELSLAENPDDSEIQYQLVNCLRESGQYDSLLAQVQSFERETGSCTPKVLSLAAEASWVTGKWKALEDLLARSPADTQEFNVGLGKAFLSLRNKDNESFVANINDLREAIARGLSPSTTASLQACHDPLLKLHVLYEVEAISGASTASQLNRDDLIAAMDRRLDVLGAFTADKQYVLSLRRAAMQFSSRGFSKLDLAASWLTTSKLARKANQNNTAFNAVLHATRLGESEAKIEHARLLWKENNHRKAIQTLEGAIAASVPQDEQALPTVGDSLTVGTNEDGSLVNKLSARAYVLKGKWLDQSGQTPSAQIVLCYHTAIKLCGRMEKGHYYLGKHYNKLLESDKSQPKVSFSTKCGDNARLIIENYLRAVMFGSKHLYETIPKILTLWLDLAMEASRDTVPKDWEKNLDKYEKDENVAVVRAHRLIIVHKQLRKYALERLPAYIFYTALPQIITRISHPHPQAYDMLSRMILRVASSHPQQSLWSILAVVKSNNPDRSGRGEAILARLKEYAKRMKSESSGSELRTLIAQGQRLSDALLRACDAHVDQRAMRVSLSKDLGFKHNLAPAGLVVPIEATLIASLPRTPEVLPRNYRAAFAGNVVTIASFSDDVLVLSSLQRPRKVTVRGSDGRPYSLLCKPKDDLRKDQRLMEFNAMVNRALLGDVESSKRQLDIKTYAVTPLNEECGACEWVEGLKPMRDIILGTYRQQGVKIDYADTRRKLDKACSDPEHLNIFTDDILKNFRPVLHEWFIETFPEPETWLAARLKYTRSCAVMSIVGHVLGLGDRHGENVLLIEDDGRVFHVDFNCLFDKGLTFEKPELVPFRLTHNMVDAMGAYGVEGPFRLAAELTLRQLRQHIDTLMTILETFLYDPTADFIQKKPRKSYKGVPSSPQEVLESVKGKVSGFLPGETVPLSVEGYVSALVERARDPKNLAAMYIGWCAFF